MSISGISGNNLAIMGSTSLTNLAAVNSGSQSSGNGSSIAGGGKFASAINLALSQLGIHSASSPTSTSATSTTQNSQQALSAFMQNLFAAMQAQMSTHLSSTSANSSSNNATHAIASTSGHHAHHGGGISKLESGLQNLLQQLSAPSPSSQTASGSSNPSLNLLQQSFNNLLSANAASGTGTTLTGFLQSLSQNMQGTQPTGNIVSTLA